MMKKSIQFKVALAGLAMGLGLTGAASAGGSCVSWCDSYSWSMQASYCAAQRGGSACASSQPLNKYFVDKCVRTYC